MNLPWAEASTLEVDKSRRTQLEQLLPHSAVAGAVTLLSRRRGAELPAALWERRPFGNSGRSAGYSCTIAGPDGAPAVTASVVLALPTTMESTWLPARKSPPAARLAQLWRTASSATPC